MPRTPLGCIIAELSAADDRPDFGLSQPSPGPDDPLLVVDCPHCGRAVPYPGRAGDGSPALAECPDPRCDVYFDFDPARVYAVAR